MGWSWDFDDGSGTSTLQHPVYTYTSTGTYDVTLTVTDDDGATDAVTQPVPVTAANVAPTAAYTVASTDLDATFTVIFKGAGFHCNDYPKRKSN